LTYHLVSLFVTIQLHGYRKVRSRYEKLQSKTAQRLLLALQASNGMGSKNIKPLEHHNMHFCHLPHSCTSQGRIVSTAETSLKCLTFSGLPFQANRCKMVMMPGEGSKEQQCTSSRAPPDHDSKLSTAIATSQA